MLYGQIEIPCLAIVTLKLREVLGVAMYLACNVSLFVLAGTMKDIDRKADIFEHVVPILGEIALEMLVHSTVVVIENSNSQSCFWDSLLHPLRTRFWRGRSERIN